MFNLFPASSKSHKIWLTTFLLVFYTITKAEAQNIQAVEVRDSSFVMGTNFYRIFYVDDYVVYQSQIHYSNSKMKARFDSVTNETVFEDSLISTGWKHNYFVFHRDSNYGYRYNPDKLWLTPRITIDSGRKSIAGANEFEKLLNQQPDSIFYSIDSTERRDIFLTPSKPDTPAIRVRLSYSRTLNHLPYSLNTSIDSARKMKLWKLEIIIEAFYHERTKTNYPEFYFGTEMRELPPIITDEVRFYLDWYKNIVQWPKDS